MGEPTLQSCPFCAGEAVHRYKRAFCADFECPGYGIDATPEQWNRRAPATREEPGGLTPESLARAFHEESAVPWDDVPFRNRALMIATAAEVLAARPAPGPQRTCEWRTDEWDGSHNTGCGQKFVVEAGTPGENDMRFCCYCGGTLIDVPFVDTEPEREG